MHPQESQLSSTLSVSQTALARRRFLQLSATAAVGVLAAPLRSVLAQRTLPTTPSFAGTDLIVHGQDPPNAEPALEHLLESWITPNKYFYVRSHAPSPKIDRKTFRLQVSGLVERELSLSADELADAEKFPQHEVTATMTCAGNRRAEYNAINKVGGVQWGAGAIGNAKWGGAALADLLKAAGVKEGAKHVWFEGVDEISHNGGIIGFGGSIPLETALGQPQAPALVAQTMNGEPLTADHGFPLRTVVPGFIGARSVKWLGKIVVSDRPSPNHYLATAYKLVQEGTDAEWESAEPLYRFPLNSVICSPAAGATVKPGEIEVAGYALPSGGPNTIERVEVATNDGRIFRPATLLDLSLPYCWRFWKATVPVTPRTKEIVVRAIDSAGNRQPRKMTWNLKGYMNNSLYHSPLQVE
ncbi:molybdopterin-dependent oxidoreductase [Lignipirellula cremea]|uniref:TMAO/DMSO reductase n=1 Tax=Lignipirellula cremea TaxID=2528010 RepID=A0A518DZP1_9BACT|nr:molybdopterin-dependent oxidoreductase [Lignipirellula cremea]QDU97304.1 TMAO/DMSO reductase [Lignipirellula cremea]